MPTLSARLVRAEIGIVMHKKILASLFLSFLVLTAGPALAGPRHGSLPQTNWTLMQTGGGGNQSGLAISNGVRLLRGDSGGPWIFGADNTWHLLNNINAFAGATGSGSPYFGWNPTKNTSQNQIMGGIAGVMEVQPCPNNSSCAYLYAAGNVFYSGNISASNPGATTWCSVNSGSSGTANSFNTTLDGGNRVIAANDPGQLMAVDPNNSNHVIVGLPGFSGAAQATISGTTMKVTSYSGQTTNAGSGILGPGVSITGPGIAAGTYIVSGVGGKGTYTVSPSQIVSSAVSISFGGLLETFNGSNCGSATWAPISTSLIPLSTDGGGAGFPSYRIAFDPSGTGTCHVGSGTCSANAYIYSNGGATDGVYSTANEGTSWTAPTTATPQVNKMKAQSGNVWMVTRSAVLDRISGGTWSLSVASNCWDVVINPANANDVDCLHSDSLSNGGVNLLATTNGTATTPTFTTINSVYPYNAGDTPWAISSYAVGYSPQTLAYDSTTGTFVANMGQWTFQTPSWPTSTFQWTAINLGVNTINNGRGKVASSQKITVGVQDEGACIYGVSGASSALSQCSTVSTFHNLTYASGLDEWMGADGKTPSGVMVAKISHDFYNVNPDLSGTSTDGMNNNWVPFNSWNVTVANTAMANNGGGGVRITVPSTTGLSNFTPGNTLGSAGNNSIMCVYANFSANTNSCWPVTNLTGTTFDLLGAKIGQFNNGATGSYLFYVPAATASNWNGAYTISGIANDRGLIKLTIASNQGLVLNGQVFCITGATITGAALNGCWVAQNASGYTFDLQASVFGSANYTGGAVGTSMNSPGGTAIAGSSTNFSVIGSNKNFPICTSNGGKDWTEMRTTGDLGSPIATVTAGGSGGSTSLTTSVAIQDTYSVIQLQSGRLFQITGSSISGTSVTLNAPIPVGDSAVGSNIYANGTGYSFASYLSDHSLASDGTYFYSVSTILGLVRWPLNCGSMVNVAPTASGGWSQWSGNNQTLKAVPGTQGHLFFTVGPQGSSGSAHPAATGLYRICNASSATSGSGTFQQVRGFYEVQAIGFGAAKPGSSYPTEFVVGWYDTAANSPRRTPSVSKAQWGVWESTNDQTSLTGTTCDVTAGDQTWTNVATATYGAPQGWPLGLSPAQAGGYGASDVNGDPFTPGLVFYSEGTQMFYGVFP